MENENHVNKHDKVTKYIIKTILLVVGLILIFYVITPLIYDRIAMSDPFPFFGLTSLLFNKWVLNFILSSFLFLNIFRFEGEKQNNQLINGQEVGESRNSTKDFYKITYRRIDEKMEYPYMHQCFNEGELESLKERLSKDCECYDIKIYSCNLNESLIETMG